MRLFVRPEAPARVDAENTWLDQASWVLLDDAGEVRSQGSGNPMPLADLAGTPALRDPDNVIVVVPAEHCLSTRCVIPGRGVGQIRRAVPFVVEEFLATDLDAMHIATGPIRRQGPIDVVAVDRSLLRGWVDAIAGLGFVPGYAYGDAALLSDRVDAITVLFDTGRALVRSPTEWLAIDVAALPAALAAALTDIEPTRELTIELVNGDLSAIARADLEQGRESRIVWQLDETEVPPLVHLARAFRPGTQAVNLLTDEFAPPRRSSESWTRWRAVAMLAGAWLLVGLVSSVAKGFWAETRADALAAEAEALYREFFPRDRRVQDVYRQMSAHLGGGGGQAGDAIALIGELTQVVQPGSGHQVRSLAFNSERVELNAEVAVPGFDALDKIKSALGERGLDVEISSAEQQDQGVLARLRIRGVS
jgi:general secretion pathway protein L